MRKSPFCTKLTQVMDFKETETHCGQSPVMIHNTSNEGIWAIKKNQISCRES